MIGNLFNSIIQNMKTTISKHLLYTWLLSHLLHPFLFGIYCNIIESNQLFFGWDHLASVLSFTCLGVMISMPVLIISFFVLPLIVFNARRPVFAMAAWILFILIAVSITAYVMLMGYMGYFNFSFLNIFVPGMMASVLSVLIRYKQFIRLIRSARHKAIVDQLKPVVL